ncbi:hypothetical protein B0H34DRAFT_841179 [Crassisporium funariophilum]|nr:hypothetical protein B0H34DRAFT_841179 [Crassisporium funariophilum]
MYCLNGTEVGVNDQDTNAAVQPLYQLKESDWWFHHENKCDEFPPAAGDFLELPVDGEFTVELAVNRAFTTYSFGGMNVAQFGDGEDHPQLGVSPDGKDSTTGCIVNPNIHAQNESMAAGTAFAISYTSNMKEVTKENLAVFTVLYHTPWRRIATYSVPHLPSCPEPGGCICAWGWVANGCGEPNMYMQPFKCRVTGNTGEAAVATAVPPVWCEDDQTKCVQGPKQMVYWNQLEGNNVEVSGFDLAGDPKAPTYNVKLGFSDGWYASSMVRSDADSAFQGAQTDIFHSAGSATPTYIKPSPSKSSSAELRVSNIFGTIVWLACGCAAVLMWCA